MVEIEEIIWDKNRELRYGELQGGEKMFQSKIFSYKFNSFHDEERREGALGFKITAIQEERAEEEAVSPKMETRRKFGVAEPNSNPGDQSNPAKCNENKSLKFFKSGGLCSVIDEEKDNNETAPLERQDSELSTLSSFSEVDLDEFYVEESPPGTEEDDNRFNFSNNSMFHQEKVFELVL